jgi:N-acetylneuraminate synthase/N,N'-diacetyllegionaminate synthase
MKQHLHIGSRQIGAGQPAFVIAEIGVNHDGKLANALQLVREARRAGADAVKIQLFSADALMHAEQAQFAAYQSTRVKAESAVHMLRRYELRPLEIATLVESIRAADMVPLATPFSLADVHTIASLDLPAVKIASPDLVNRPLIAAAAKLRRPMLVSTGAATMDEVSQCVAWLRELRAEFVLLHCVSSYPAPDEQANLRWINELAERFLVPVGYSDHTTQPLAGAFAVAGGACVVEKHLTYDRFAEGPDHAASADPRQFADYVSAIRLAERLAGKGGKRVLPIERDVRSVSRQSVVLCRDLSEGEEIAEADVVFQRPGTGIPAAQLAALVGKRVRQTLRAGTLLQWHMLADVA